MILHAGLGVLIAFAEKFNPAVAEEMAAVFFDSDIKMCGQSDLAEKAEEEEGPAQTQPAAVVRIFPKNFGDVLINFFGEDEGLFPRRRGDRLRSDDEHEAGEGEGPEEEGEDGAPPRDAQEKPEVINRREPLPDLRRLFPELAHGPSGKKTGRGSRNKAGMRLELESEKKESRSPVAGR